MICTGLTFLNVSNTRLASQCTAVCRVRRQSTSPTVALRSQRSLADATYARPVNITYLYHYTSSVPSAVKPSLLQARWSGTLYRAVSATRLSAAVISGNYLKRTSSTVTQRSRDTHDSALYKCMIDTNKLNLHYSINPIVQKKNCDYNV